MADQMKDQGTSETGSEQVRSRVVNDDVDEFDEVTEDQDDEEDVDDEEDSTF